MVCIFCEFISGKRKKHVNGAPFRRLHETQHILTFLSIDFPAAENGHTIVVTKKHFKLLEDTPNKILFALAKEIKLVSKVLKGTNEGTNVLLNNGRCAGQKIPHVHFHIIPRNKGDNIDLEYFKRKKLSLKDFTKLHNKLKQKFRLHQL